MQTQKSAVPAATGHDAKLEPTQMNSNPNVATTAPAVKLSVAERMRVHREYYQGLDEILAIFARQHNTADRSKGAGRPPKNDDGSRTYKMYPPIKRNRIAPEDPADLLRVLVYHTVQCVNAERATGFYLFEYSGPDAALIRWVEGFCEEAVCQVRFNQQRALFLASVSDAHEKLQRAFELIDFGVFAVEGFISPVCPSCQGGGTIVDEFSNGASYCVDVATCDACSGAGVLAP